MGIQQCIILSHGDNNVLSYHKSKGSENGVGGSEYACLDPVLRYTYTSRKGQVTGMNQLSVFTGSGLCQHMHMATVMNA